MAGVAIEAACVAVAISGQAIPHFWWALVLLGIGWNFTYVGGTALLTEAYRPAEKAKVQGLNEVLVYSAQALASLSSGVLVNTTGWTTLNYFAIPVLAIAGMAALWLALRRRAAAATS
jgi:MFS family permease